MIYFGKKWLMVPDLGSFLPVRLQDPWLYTQELCVDGANQGQGRRLSVLYMTMAAD